MDEESIFLEALQKPTPVERLAFIEQACAGDAALRRGIERLLQAHERAGRFLQDEPGVATVDHPACDGPATVIGPYKLLEQIGEGGFGVVFMAEQQQPVRRKVALKVLKPGMDTRQVVARFEAERQALALMDHPNIARVFDGGETAGGRPYFVMELVKGIPITDYCVQAQLLHRQRLELFLDVCHAVQHAHQKGIIHRDLKPSNVLVTLHDGTPVVKVIDFGIAKATAQPLTDKTLFTNFAQLVGTPLYMSPEQAALSGLDVDTRSDIYALGVLLYELLTGTTPFDKERFKTASYDEMRRIICEEEPPRPSTRISTLGQVATTLKAPATSDPRRLAQMVRGELDWIAMKCLEKDRNRRYGTAHALARDVERYLHDEPVQACPPSALYRAGKFIRRNRAGVLVAASLVLGLLLALAGLVVAVVVQSASKQRIVAEQRQTNHALSREKSANEQLLRVLAEKRRRDYIHRVNLAYRECLANNVALAERLLDGCEPALRGWEWSYCRGLCHQEARTFGGFADHAASVAAAPHGMVRGLAYSPDGGWIAAANHDGTVSLWDATTGRELRTLRGHEGAVEAIAIDRGGRRLASAGEDKTVRIWDPATGDQLRVLRGHSEPVTGVAWCPVRDEVVSVAYCPREHVERGAEIKQWDPATGQELRAFYNGLGWNSTGVAYSPDGRHFGTISDWGANIRVWDATDGHAIAVRRTDADGLLAVAIDPKGDRVAAARNGAGAVMVWNPATDGVVFCRGHDGPAYSVAFSPDGQRLASAGEDGTLRLWNPATGAALVTLRGHTSSVAAVAFSPDGRSLVSAGAGAIKAWDLTAPRGVLPLRLGGWGFRVRFTSDGRRMAIARYGAVVFLDSATDEQVSLIPFPRGITGLALSPDGRQVVMCGESSDFAAVFDATTGRPLATLKGHDGVVCDVAFRPDGGRIASAGEDGTVRLWDTETGELVRVLRGHAGGVFSVAFLPAGGQIASTGRDGTVRIWDEATGAEIRSFTGTVHHRSILSGDALAFDRGGRRLAAASDDGKVIVRDLATGVEVFTLRGHTGGVPGVAFSPDGSRIATAGLDHTIKLWDAATGEEIFTLRGHSGGVLGFAFSRDGRRIVSTGADGTVRTWEALSGAGLLTPPSARP
jgi:WD40 repeat protein/serine/threonine protein kinase